LGKPALRKRGFDAGNAAMVGEIKVIGEFR